MTDVQLNPTLTDDLYQKLEGQPLRSMGQQLGIGPAQMAGAVSAALPLILGALGRNARQDRGANQLFEALQQDHAGTDVERMLSRPDALGQDPSSAKMLGHIFGGRQPAIEQTLGRVTGLGGNGANSMLRLLAPLVLAYLAKRVFDKRQQAQGQAQGPSQQTQANPEVLGRVLDEEGNRIGQQGGIGGGLLGVLDRDQDGDVDIADLLGMARGKGQPAASRPF